MGGEERSACWQIWNTEEQDTSCIVGTESSWPQKGSKGAACERKVLEISKKPSVAFSPEQEKKPTKEKMGWEYVVVRTRGWTGAPFI